MRAAVERDLAAGVAHLRPQVPAVQLDQPLADEEPQPEKERHRRVRAGTPASRGSASRYASWMHVGGVDPPLEPAVQAQGDHPPQPVAVTVEEGPPRFRVTCRRAEEQPAHLAGVGG